MVAGGLEIGGAELVGGSPSDKELLITLFWKIVGGVDVAVVLAVPGDKAVVHGVAVVGGFPSDEKFLMKLLFKLVGGAVA